MPAKAWKRQEREVAKLLGGTRNPNSGQSAPDIVGVPGWSIEVKARKRLPAWLTHAYEQAARNAQAGERPMVILVEVSQGVKATRYAVIRLDDACGK